MRRRPYIARITVGWDEYTGKQLYKQIGSYTTYPDAMKALSEFNSDPYDINASQLTFSDMYDKWAKYKYPKISPSMVASYKGAYKSCKNIHHVPFINIRRFQIQTAIDECGKSYTGKERLKMLISQIFDYAVENEFVKKNYCIGIELGEKPEPVLKRIPFDKKEIEKLYKSIHLYRYTDTILMMIFTGVRPSELLTIQTQNVFLDKNYFTCGIKNTSSKNRMVPICRFVKPFFEKYYEQAISNDSKWLISNTVGTQMKYSNYNRDKFHKIMEQLEMEHMPHDCRHTFASLMDSADANKLCIQRIMGHSPKVLIDSVYTHKTLQELQHEINKLENLLNLNKCLNSINKKYFKNI